MTAACGLGGGVDSACVVRVAVGVGVSGRAWGRGGGKVGPG